jgi:phasin family protein
MFDKMTEQFQKMGQPAGELFSLGTETIKKVTEANVALVKGMVDDTMKFAREVTSVSKPADFMELQKAFVESMQENVSSAAQAVFSELSNAQEKAGEFFKGSVERAQAATAETLNPSAK